MNNISILKLIELEVHHQEQEKKTKEHKLAQLFWECTVKCNQDCLNCGGDCRKMADVSDMPLESFITVLDNIASYQEPSETIIIISGGEPLLRPDLEICGKEISKRGFKWGIVTNGELLTQERFDSLCNAGMQSITISLDGFEDEHNWLHNNKNCYENTCKAIQLVNMHPSIMCEVVTCVNHRNFDYLPELAGHLINLGVERWRLYAAYPSKKTEKNPDLKLEPYQMKLLMKFIKKQREQQYMYVSYGCEGFLGEYEKEVRDRFFSCQAGISIGSVKVNGDIGGCLSICSAYSQGNIYEDEFMDVWNTCFRQYRNREWMHTGICYHCKMFRFCKGNGMHLRNSEGQLTRCAYYSCK